MKTYVLTKGDIKIYAVEVERKQIHQLVVTVLGDIGPFKYGDKAIINLSTLDMTRIEAA